MATASSLPEEDCTCPVCCDIFNDPVVLLCGHSFCKDCLLEWWRQSASQKCPVCKEIFSMPQPPRNLALRNLSEAMRKKATSTDPRDFCTQHEEKFKFFCVTDQQPICLVCRDAKEHKKHRCVPINEAAQEARPKLKVALMRLKTERGSAENAKVTLDKMAKHIKAQEAESQIKKDFQKLYQFLQAEEATRIDALRREENLKSQLMNIKIMDLTAVTSSLSDSIKAMEEDIEAKDALFMLKFKSNMSKTQRILPDVEKPSTDLIDVAKHLGNLTFNVWNKMKRIVEYRPVILDPNTAYSSQTVSKDLTTFVNGVNDVPDNTMRFWAGVMGSAAYSSGRHSWNIEVDGDSLCHLGVCASNGDKWTVTEHIKNCLVDCIPHKAGSIIFRGDIPKRLRVQLDYDKGKLSFHNLDTNVHIYTIEYAFTQPVYPFCSGNGKILPVAF